MKIISYLFPSLTLQNLASKNAMLPLRHHGKLIYIRKFKDLGRLSG